jgi:WD40 repeat protein
MAFSSDGTMFLITTVNGDVTVYNTDGEILSQLKGYTYIVNAKFLPGNKSVITIGEGTIRLWTLNNLPVKEFVYDDHINTVGFSPDNKQILIGAWHHARILSINGMQLSQMDPHANDYIASAEFSPSGNMILITSSNSFSIYNAEWKLINKVESTATLFSIFSPDSKKVLLCLRDSTAKLFDVHGNLLQRFNQKSELTSACFSPDGKLLLTGTRDGEAYLWDMSGKVIRVFKDYGFTPCVAFSPDGKFVTTAGSNHTITLWNLKGERIREFKGHVSQINDMCFSPNGDYLYSCSADNTAKVWNMKGEIMKEIKQPGNITSIAVSADSKMFLSGSMNYSVKLWNSPILLSDFLNGEALSELTDAQKKYYNIN